LTKKNTVYYPLWKELYEVFKNNEYGSVISYKDLSDCIDVDIKNHRYIVDRFKKEMLRRDDKALSSVRNVGYRIVMPNEHGRLAYCELKRAERRTRQGVEYALHVPFDMLNDQEKAQLTLIANRIQIVHAGLIGECKSIHTTTVHFELPGTPRPKI